MLMINKKWKIYNSIVRIIFKCIEWMRFVTYELYSDVYKDKGLSSNFPYISQFNIQVMFKAMTTKSTCQKPWSKKTRWKNSLIKYFI